MVSLEMRRIVYLYLPWHELAIEEAPGELTERQEERLPSDSHGVAGTGFCFAA